MDFFFKKKKSFQIVVSSASRRSAPGPSRNAPAELNKERRKKMNKKFGARGAPDWWSEELATWANNQRTFAKAFKKPASERSKAEKTFAGQNYRAPRRAAPWHRPLYVVVCNSLL